MKGLLNRGTAGAHRHNFLSLVASRDANAEIASAERRCKVNMLLWVDYEGPTRLYEQVLTLNCYRLVNISYVDRPLGSHYTLLCYGCGRSTAMAWSWPRSLLGWFAWPQFEEISGTCRWHCNWRNLMKNVSAGAASGAPDSQGLCAEN